LVPRGIRMMNGEGSTVRNVIVCTVHLIVRLIKSRKLRWAGNVARMEKGRSAFKILKGTPRGKRPLGRPRRRWEDNIQWTLNK
jgi:hypothetical protein